MWVTSESKLYVIKVDLPGKTKNEKNKCSVHYFNFVIWNRTLKFWHNTSLKLHRKVTKIFANLGNGLHFKVYSVFGQNLRNDTQEGICDRCMSFCPTNFKKRKNQLLRFSRLTAACSVNFLCVLRRRTWLWKAWRKTDKKIVWCFKDYVSYAYLDILSVQTSLSAVPRFHLSRNGVFADSDIISKPIMQ